MRVLVVDNNIMRESWGASELVRLARSRQGVTVEVRRAPHRDLPRDLGRFDRVILSGSMTGATDEAPWIGDLEAAIRFWVDRGTPLLGVCYGHQMIARALGGKAAVRRGDRPELGWARIERLGASRLLEGLPDSFHTFAWHFDEVVQIPAEMRLVARSERCPIQAFEHRSKPVYGVQFHPERDDQAGARSLRERMKKEPGFRDYLEPDQGTALYDPRVADAIFGNFLL